MVKLSINCGVLQKNIHGLKGSSRFKIGSFPRTSSVSYQSNGEYSRHVAVSLRRTIKQLQNSAFKVEMQKAIDWSGLEEVKEDADTRIAALSTQHSITNESFFFNHLGALSIQDLSSQIQYF